MAPFEDPFRARMDLGAAAGFFTPWALHPSGCPMNVIDMNHRQPRARAEPAKLRRLDAFAMPDLPSTYDDELHKQYVFK